MFLRYIAAILVSCKSYFSQQVNFKRPQRIILDMLLKADKLTSLSLHIWNCAHFKSCFLRCQSHVSTAQAPLPHKV